MFKIFNIAPTLYTLKTFEKSCKISQRVIWPRTPTWWSHFWLNEILARKLRKRAGINWKQAVNQAVTLKYIAKHLEMKTTIAGTFPGPVNFFALIDAANRWPTNTIASDLVHSVVERFNICILELYNIINGLKSNSGAYNVRYFAIVRYSVFSIFADSDDKLLILPVTTPIIPLSFKTLSRRACKVFRTSGKAL